MTESEPRKPYDYARREGVHPLSWDEFSDLAALLAESLAGFGIEAVVGIARAGLFPATAVALSLRTELYPARLSRRENDVVISEQPRWITPVSPWVAGKVVAVVDEIADTGQTLALAAEETLRLGAKKVVTACLVRHSWAQPVPDVCALVTDELVIFPWDRRVFQAGRWQPHPEMEAALRLLQAKKGDAL
jgi:hypoxanthine phosphoribosyltransferase